MQDTWVWSLGWEDSLEKGMATYSSILAWRIPWSLEGYRPWGRKELDTTERLTLSLYLIIWQDVGFPGGAGGKEPACQCRRRKRHDWSDFTHTRASQDVIQKYNKMHFIMCFTYKYENEIWIINPCYRESLLSVSSWMSQDWAPDWKPSRCRKQWTLIKKSNQQSVHSLATDPCLYTSERLSK